MTVENIIKAVRWCIDEEMLNNANFNNAAGNDTAYMDNIIKDKIGDALRWICLYAPADLLGGSDESEEVGGVDVPIDTGILVDMPKTGTLVPTVITGTDGGKLTMPADFVKIARVRVAGWHRAVKSLISEDSDEYLQLRDDSGAKATEDRPQAVLIEKSTREIEVWPTGTSAEYTYVANVDPEEHAFDVTSGEPAVTERHYPLPPRVKTSFVYYLAFLLLSAYGDARSERMLEIAMQNLKVNVKQ